MNKTLFVFYFSFYYCLYFFSAHTEFCIFINFFWIFLIRFCYRNKIKDPHTEPPVPYFLSYVWSCDHRPATVMGDGRRQSKYNNLLIYYKSTKSRGFLITINIFYCRLRLTVDYNKLINLLYLCQCNFYDRWIFLILIEYSLRFLCSKFK